MQSDISQNNPNGLAPTERLPLIALSALPKARDFPDIDYAAALEKQINTRPRIDPVQTTRARWNDLTVRQSSTAYAPGSQLILCASDASDALMFPIPAADSPPPSPCYPL